MQKEPASMRYIGSKTSTLPWLTAFVAKHAPDARSLCDPFAGTCTVARAFKRAGFRVVTGDVLDLSHTIQVATVGLNEVPAFARLKRSVSIAKRHEATPAERVVAHLNGLRGCKHYISRNFSQASGRLYFTDDNAAKIDAMRGRIAEWVSGGEIDREEEAYLLAALIVSADKVANTAGTYYAYLKALSRKAVKDIELEPLPVFDNGLKNRCRKADARLLAASTTTDILYLDPPYNSRDYGGYYHLPESIVRNDRPTPGGVSGAPRERRIEKSDFCRPGYAGSALERLVSRARARYILIHYTTDGLVAHDTIMSMLRGRGSASYRDLPVRAYSSHSDAVTQVAMHRVYWCKVRESQED
jgi:adenine-specific DNA-methyltransferase